MATLYVYAVTCDSNFAPCFDNNVFSLACCKGGKKGGMRSNINNAKDRGEDVYILGVCSKTLSKEAKRYLKDEIDRVYKPLFYARVEKCVEYKKYYSNTSEYKSRNDQKAYYVTEEGIKPREEKNNPHNKGSYAEESINRDIGGNYVLISNEFVYLGNQCGKISTSLEEKYKYIFRTDANKSGQKAGIDKHYRGYIVFEEVDTEVIKDSMTAAKSFVSDKNVQRLGKEYKSAERDDDGNVISCRCGGR